MNNKGIIEVVIGQKDYPYWDITLLENEITLFSNGYYLGYEEASNKLVSYKYMKRWNYTYIDGNYLIKTKNNLFISINEGTLCVNDNKNENSIFQFIDID